MSGNLIMLAVGDIILDTTPSKAKSLFSLVAPVLQSADIVVGQGENVFTSRSIPTFTEMLPPLTPCDPKNIDALSAAGFNVITLAGNHTWDAGVPGIVDSIAGLKNHGIATTGAGGNINEARRPAIIDRDGTLFGFLSYNCVGPHVSWATPDKPGCAYVRIISHYELDIANPGGAPTTYTFAEPDSLKALVTDIQNLRPLCDVIVVSFHKGILSLPTRLAMYDQQISFAAIDAGADVILGHHAHILKGIEKYKGKMIFHGLSNFAVVIDHKPNIGPRDQKHSAALSKPMGWWAESEAPASGRTEDDKKKTIIAKFTINNGQISKVSYLPCLINEYGQPAICKNGTTGRCVSDYMDRISKAAGLNTLYEWKGDEVVVR